MVLPDGRSGRDPEVKSCVLRRIAVLVSFNPRAGENGGELRVSDVDTLRELSLGASSFVLVLENDTPDTFVRGQLRILRDGTNYPIQSNVALFELLMNVLDRDAGSD
jgi:hypothetical protein